MRVGYLTRGLRRRERLNNVRKNLGHEIGDAGCVTGSAEIGDRCAAGSPGVQGEGADERRLRGGDTDTRLRGPAVPRTERTIRRGRLSDRS